VLLACRRILRDREIEDDPADVMSAAIALREQAAELALARGETGLGEPWRRRASEFASRLGLPALP
jgi:hypothetical protein